MPSFIGRRESIGIGKESTPGTSVAPSFWQPHLSLKLKRDTDVAQNLSAMGVEDEVNDSVVVDQWAEGPLDGKITDITFGLLLLNMFGSESSAVKETTAYNHTFTKNNASVPPYLTFCRVSPVATRRYALGCQTDLQIEASQRGFVTFTSGITSKTGATASDTPAYTDENEFSSKHVHVKIASNTAGLSGATDLDLKSVKLKIEHKRDRHTPLGVIDPTAFDPLEWKVTGEVVLRYTDTTIEDLGAANTRQAMSISLINNDVTIGASSNPSLVFTMPKVKFSPIDLDDNLNQVINQTVPFVAELDQIAGYTIQAVLTNTRNTAY